jgi:hypothetical protein
VTVRTQVDHLIGETSDDLRSWTRSLAGCPPVTHTLLAACPAPAHNGEKPTWFFPSADADEGVAQLRCVACGTATDVMDSGDHWTYPHVWACLSCGQSMGEVVLGLHAEDDSEDASGPFVTWLAVTVRCIGCGRIDGLTDMHVPHVALETIASSF